MDKNEGKIIIKPYETFENLKSGNAFIRNNLDVINKSVNERKERNLEMKLDVAIDTAIERMK